MPKKRYVSQDRRNKGEFYTPTLFVDYAHRMIAEQLGEDWKEKYVVWDNCCGTKNLTRDYFFKELYCSTLENAELAISDRYNREATSFQFDFLNDSLDKLPEGLRNALENNKPIIFFINPPYATASSGGFKNKGIKNMGNKINDEMVEKKMGLASNNLYAQFLYRIILIKEQYNLTDVHIALFCKPNYLSGVGYKEFRKMFLSSFSYSNGILFQASHFADVADSWGINFTIWDCGETTDKENFVHSLVDNQDGEIVEFGKKNIYNVDFSKRGKEWIKETLGELTYADCPKMTNGLNITESEGAKSRIAENALGCFRNQGNDVLNGMQYSALYSSCDSSKACGLSIMPQNFERVMAMFAVRRMMESDWVNAMDEYLAPDETNEHYNEFVNDSIIYSLFHSASNQSSLRQVEYKGKLWDIKNEFFFMPKEEVKELANDCHLDFTYNDARVSSDRYVYTKLQGIELSAEAKAVLDKAIELTRVSFKYRELFNEEHPEYQILNWDCGWYQIKGMLKEFMPNELKEFNELFKALADKMRPMVYELGFLK